MSILWWAYQTTETTIAIKSAFASLLLPLSKFSPKTTSLLSKSLYFTIVFSSRRYMAGILPIRRKTQINQSINLFSICLSTTTKWKYSRSRVWALNCLMFLQLLSPTPAPSNPIPKSMNYFILKFYDPAFM